MYNEQQKMDYLNEIIKESSPNYNTIMTYFNKCSEIETITEKDISCFNLNEIIGYYKQLNTTSSQYLQSLNSQLGAYTGWCQNSGSVPDNQNHFKEVTRKMLEQCINEHLLKRQRITRDELLQELSEQKFNICEDFLLLALFEGICGKRYSEIRSLSLKNFKGNKVVFENREFEVSNKLIELATESAETYYYIDSKASKRNLDPDDKRCFKFPKKTVGDENKEVFFIIRKLQKLKSEYDLYYVSSDCLKESGRLDMIKRIMRENNWSAETAIRNRIKDIEYRYGRIMSIPIYLRNNIDFLEEK